MLCILRDQLVGRVGGWYLVTSPNSNMLILSETPLVTPRVPAPGRKRQGPSTLRHRLCHTNYPSTPALLATTAILIFFWILRDEFISAVRMPCQLVEASLDDEGTCE